MENNTIVSYPYSVEMYFRVTGDFDMRSYDTNLLFIILFEMFFGC